MSFTTFLLYSRAAAATGLERGEQHAEHHGVAGGGVGEQDEQPSCGRVRAPGGVGMKTHRQRPPEEHFESGPTGNYS